MQYSRLNGVLEGIFAEAAARAVSIALTFARAGQLSRRPGKAKIFVQPILGD